jgi:DNA (cytosine-5)-methyltransferase 1
MKVIDLFSGIGGFSLGLESAGAFETIQFVENEPWCQKILAKNFPGVSIAGDIREYEGQRADVVVGGFPCQPFSVAGKRKGTRDDRHLWPEMLRVIKASKPRWVIGENVRNLTSIQDGMVFEQVCTDLEEQGYEVQSFVIPASAVNAPHQRYRVWIVAYSENRGREQTEWKRRQSLERGSYDSGGIETERQEVVTNVANTQCNGLTSTKERGGIEETIREESQGQNRTLDSQRASGLSETKGNVANTNNTGDRTSEHETQRQGQKIDQRREELTQFESSRLCNSVANSESNKQDGISGETESEHDKRNSWMESQCSRNRQSVGKPEQNVADSKISERNALQTNREYGETTPQEVFRDRSCIRRQTSWWSFEPRVGRVAHGIPDRVDRLKGLGNAIVPQIAYQIGLAILQAEKEK